MKHSSFICQVRRAWLLIVMGFYPTLAIAQNYWDQVPPLTSLCYSEQDPFRQTLDDLRFEIKGKMEAIKQADEEKAQNMTQEELMAVAMQYQNMNPDEIMKFQTEMAEMTTLQADFQEKVSSMEMRYNDLEAEFRNEFQTRLAPIEKEVRELPDGEGTPQWAIDRAEELIAQYDMEYESICQMYITAPDAKFRNWLRDFQKFLIEEELPYSEKMIKMEYAQFGLEPDLSVASLAAVERYLEKSSSISDLRRPYPQRG